MTLKQKISRRPAAARRRQAGLLQTNSLFKRWLAEMSFAQSYDADRP
jgi:hypothetical protein